MLPVGAEALSDPVTLTVPSDNNLAVSLFTSSTTGTPTIHVFAAQTNYVASGNFAAGESGSAFTDTATTWYFLDGVDVLVSPSI
jgi:hypothetical protein